MPKSQIEISSIEFDAKLYQQMFADELIENGFLNGFLIQDGVIIEKMIKIGSNVRKPSRPYFTLGLVSNEHIYKADYIIFERYKDVFANSSYMNMDVKL